MVDTHPIRSLERKKNTVSARYLLYYIFVSVPVCVTHFQLMFVREFSFSHCCYISFRWYSRKFRVRIANANSNRGWLFYFHCCCRIVTWYFVVCCWHCQTKLLVEMFLTVSLLFLLLLMFIIIIEPFLFRFPIFSFQLCFVYEILCQIGWQRIMVTLARIVFYTYFSV